ncbi:carboxymuconolactone decarboxylase family protein [Halobacteriovorax sp. GB3]|uniref:carboxymuconolactone decarboxylase family protein n=1 Tax=Halobacteriovorax sp. GB3 TaxID=2719615 RepID=UPI002361E4DB|nr:carboxymuconolactone decarboxylase family protein [Halobacteriovorax sp. GB3]MDD0854288.1 carboxymuconolactone decarboxylase family protein [Halobacteriovorax sp. GB3]
MRLNYFKEAPEAMVHIMAMEKYVKSLISNGSFDYKLAELVKIRTSQINDCGYCVDMHTKDTRANEESENRLYLLAHWKEANCFTDKEKSVLEWCEVVTKLIKGEREDKAYMELKTFLNDKEIVDLTFVITLMNTWNRIAFAFKPVVGSYNVGDFE